jgi:hypothetical protein
MRVDQAGELGEQLALFARDLADALEHRRATRSCGLGVNRAS